MGLVTCLGRKSSEGDEIAGEELPTEVSFTDLQIMVARVALCFQMGVGHFVLLMM